ncbi:hypothetical protein C0J52_11184 [Blattella germanica]|nr:hypothetical protein C0J52_11184 [Blattella germanica]
MKIHKMLELPYYVKTVLKHCLVASVLLMLVAQCQGGTVASNPTAVTGNDIRATLNNAVIEDRSNKRPGWWPLVQCIFLADINKCLQDRTVRGLMGIGRGKKKKKKKEKKRALIKLILLVLLIKLKIAKFLYFVGKLMEFKFVAFVGINTLINVIRFIMEWRKKKDDGKIYYSYEQAHHQHHYDEHHHGDPYSYDHQDDDKGWLNGIWNRRGLVGSGDQPVDLTYNQAQKPANRDYAQDLAYGAHNPTYNGQLNVGEKKIN